LSRRIAAETDARPPGNKGASMDGGRCNNDRALLTNCNVSADAPAVQSHSFDTAVESTNSEVRRTMMKRSKALWIAGALVAALLGGCVVAPAPGYYGYYGGYHHGYYYDR
jgi:hypothetical protein